MSVQLDFDIDVLQRRIEDDLEGAVVKTLDGVLEDIKPFVPYKTGELNNSAVIDESSMSIVWEAEHAEYVYDMPKSNNFDRSVHNRATSEWVDEALQAYHKKWIEDLKNNFRKRDK